MGPFVTLDECKTAHGGTVASANSLAQRPSQKAGLEMSDTNSWSGNEAVKSSSRDSGKP